MQFSGLIKFLTCLSKRLSEKESYQLPQIRNTYNFRAVGNGNRISFFVTSRKKTSEPHFVVNIDFGLYRDDEGN